MSPPAVVDSSWRRLYSLYVICCRQLPSTAAGGDFVYLLFVAATFRRLRVSHFVSAVDSTVTSAYLSTVFSTFSSAIWTTFSTALWTTICSTKSTTLSAAVVEADWPTNFQVLQPTSFSAVDAAIEPTLQPTISKAVHTAVNVTFVTAMDTAIYAAMDTAIDVLVICRRQLPARVAGGDYIYCLLYIKFI